MIAVMNGWLDAGWIDHVSIPPKLSYEDPPYWRPALPKKPLRNLINRTHIFRDKITPRKNSLSVDSKSEIIKKAMSAFFWVPDEGGVHSSVRVRSQAMLRRRKRKWGGPLQADLSWRTLSCHRLFVARWIVMADLVARCSSSGFNRCERVQRCPSFNSWSFLSLLNARCQPQLPTLLKKKKIRVGVGLEFKVRLVLLRNHMYPFWYSLKPQSIWSEI